MSASSGLPEVGKSDLRWSDDPEKLSDRELLEHLLVAVQRNRRTAGRVIDLLVDEEEQREEMMREEVRGLGDAIAKIVRKELKAVIGEAVREAVKSELATEFGTMLREILEITSQDKEDAIADALERAGVAGSDWEEEENG